MKNQLQALDEVISNFTEDEKQIMDAIVFHISSQRHGCT